MIEVDFAKFSPEDQERLRSVQFGIDVEAFLKSTVGQYLVARAEAERTAALEALAECDPTNINRIRELQSTVKRCDSFGQWLADVTITAKNAQDELEGGQ